MTDQKIIDLCAQKSDSFYLYDERIILDNIAILRENFPHIEFLYSIKCNSNRHVMQCVFSQNFGADAASAGEVALARSLGLPANRVFYSAPGKSLRDIENTLDQAVIIADSLNEIKRIQSVAEAFGRVIKIGIRINPNFSFDGDGGQASKFGIDEDQALAWARSNPCKNVKIVGIHVHLKSQVLNAGALAAYYKKIFQLAEQFTRILGMLEYVNMGSGMGIQYAPTDAALDMTALSEACRHPLELFRSTYPNTRLLIEVGRYAVCKSGIYVTKVMDRKISHGKIYLILKNTLNGFIRPSLEKLVERYSSDQAPTAAEPLFTCKNAFELIAPQKSDITETVTLVGNLCTATDVIAENISLPQLECGDLLIITNAGSYAAVLSPMQFSSQEKPKEFFISKTDAVLSDENTASSFSHH